ncbi:hypothetical protein B0T17DRAFT_510880 [Bombardia bombarda]|uniref:Uncharacterized protein n=1 Tax=Bombardia bombarda TaxID=252184 RepID=A0AA40BVE5_9PEZI|nr:hypothetical protein B0T17DRAFT_510880 [Bombardia bombarda]
MRYTFGPHIRYNNIANRRPLAANGSRASFMSDKCIAALKERTETAYVVRGKVLKYGSLMSCQEVSVPEECGTKIAGTGVDLPSYAGVPMPYLNGNVTNQDGYSSDNETTAQNVRDMWDGLVLNYYVIVTMFAPTGNGSENWDGSPGMASVNCVGPTGVGTGRQREMVATQVVVAVRRQRRAMGTKIMVQLSLMMWAVVG